MHRKYSRVMLQRVDSPAFPVLDRGNELLKQFGLSDWRFELSREKNTLGRCEHSDRTISFSQYYLHLPMEEIEDTILHEIAHALVGPKHGHDYVWKAKCREIGARPERLAPPEIKTSAKPNYRIECPDCGWHTDRFRMRRRNFGAKCPECHTEVKIYKYKR